MQPSLFLPASLLRPLEYIVLTILPMRKITFSLLLSLFLLAGCLPGVPQQTGAPVSGKVSDHRQPVAGVRVEAFPVSRGALSGRPPFLSELSGSDGHFHLGLPPGSYYLLARGEGRFAYYGRNPVTVPATGLSEVNIGLVPTAPAPRVGTPFIDGGVVGRILHDGKPLAGAIVYLYTDLTSDLKGMGYAMGGPSDADGYFEVGVPPGTYYLVARHRQGAASVGPLRAGDFMGYYPGNPIKVGEAAVVPVTVPTLVVPAKVDQLQASLFGRTSIQGRILDRHGAPVAGARAVLYDDPQMLNRPRFVSAPTGADGAYVLSFPKGGTYYLGARNTLGGAPAPGDLYGTWDGNPDHSLQVKEGAALTGIDITVEEMW